MTTALFAACFASTASATDIGGSVQLEIGTVHNNDSSWDLFSNKNGMPTRGVRGGVSIGDHLSILGGWQRTSRGLQVHMPDSQGNEQAAFQTAYTGDFLSVGPQLGVTIGDVVHPYVSVEGLLLRGVMRFDDDPNTKSNLGQVLGAGASSGLATMGGVEFRSPTGVVGLQVTFFIEAGRSWFAEGSYGDLGQMTPGGFTMRGGAGLRF
jgi:opacity protein-like surface antigen